MTLVLRELKGSGLVSESSHCDWAEVQHLAYMFLGMHCVRARVHAHERTCARACTPVCQQVWACRCRGVGVGVCFPLCARVSGDTLMKAWNFR